MNSVLVTGGAGYVGSHVTLALEARGLRCVVLDDLSNSSPESIERVSRLAGRKVALVVADVRDIQAVTRALREHRVEAVVHMSGLKSVEESVRQPGRYYDTNVVGALRLVEAMREAGVRRFVFSSTASVYGDPERSPIPESARLNPANPYGRTKLVVEMLLRDVAIACPDWQVALLRYFNPVGAHESGTIGECPRSEPRNLFPVLCRAAAGAGPALRIFGTDFPTPDGYAMRDYVHVMDVAEGHAAALEALVAATAQERVLVSNLGTGRGLSVMEVIRAFELATGKAVPHQVGPRREGDVPAYWADPAFAEGRLGWRAKRTLADMCRDAWRWQAQNPEGFPFDRDSLTTP